MSRLTASGAGDAVDQPNNVYSSIPEAQITHQQYKAAHDQVHVHVHVHVHAYVRKGSSNKL